MTQDRTEKIPLVFLLLIFSMVLLRNAWISEDAFITFRTVDNFVAGYGLTWNTAERVQAYTNPLWMFLVSGFYTLTGEVYFTSLMLSFVASLVAIFLYVFGVARSPMAAAVGVAGLIFSKSFVDYSSSGLENPLTYLLLAVFFVVYFKSDSEPQRDFLLSFIAALGMVNRMDTALLFIPALAYRWVKQRNRKTFVAMALGASPLVLWELFSLLYYGFLFPNTAYGKLNTGIPQSELTEQGLYYFLNCLQQDPLTLLIIFVALVFPFVLRDWSALPLVGGMVLYLLYIVRIGGDFMSGRFFSAVVFCAVLVIGRARWRSWHSFLPALGLILVVGFTSPNPPLLSGADYGVDLEERRQPNRIADERAIFYRSSGLLRAVRNAEKPEHTYAVEGRKAKAEGEPVVERAAIGLFGFYAGPNVHIVDIYGLADPLLARLPSRVNPGWRVGHFVRVVPAGYIRSLETGENHFRDRNLGEYYEKLRVITRRRLFDWNRWLTIWQMNTGGYDHLIDFESYRYPGMVRRKLGRVREAPFAGDAERSATVFSRSGIEIAFGKRYQSKAVEISLDRNDDYEIVYLLEEQELARQQVRRLDAEDPGLESHLLDVPAEAVRKGYDRIRIFPLGGDKRYRMGHMRLR